MDVIIGVFGARLAAIGAQSGRTGAPKGHFVRHPRPTVVSHRFCMENGRPQGIPAVGAGTPLGCGKTAFWHLDSDITMCLLMFGRTAAV